MIVERIFQYPKPGCGDDLVELIKAEGQRFSSPHLHAVRIYSGDIGCSAPISQEFEFESYEERGQFWRDWENARGADFGKEWAPLVSQTFSRETWNLE